MHFSPEQLKRYTIFLTKHGSHAYGLNTPTSDLDLKGVFIAPREYYLGFVGQVEQVEGKDPHDLVIYELRKFFRLAADCNPNIIEVLHTSDEDVLECSAIGEYLRSLRDLFISAKAKFTFSGYAMAQLKRLRAHYRWLKYPLQAPPTRAEFGLPEFTAISRDQLMAAESLVSKKVESWMPVLDDLSESSKIALTNQLEEFLNELTVNAGVFKASRRSWLKPKTWFAKADPDKDRFLEWGASRAIGYDENFLMILDRERRYSGAKHEWDQFQRWKKERNVKRSELEAKHGYDTKHAMHLVRLLRMGKEILLTGKVVVKRPDREELLAVRQGAWSYEQLVGWAEEQDRELDEIYRLGKYVVPRQPDRNRLDEECVLLVERAWGV